MKFEKYQHVERLGTDATDGILDGKCYIFPKLDGTNTSVYLNDAGEVEVASRNRILSVHNDNQGVCNYVLSQPKFKVYLMKYPTRRLFGEWLVPHTFRGYQADAWRKLYIFDIMEGDKYIPYGEYVQSLFVAGIDYVPAINYLKNPTQEELIKTSDKNNYLMQDGQIGEGIVIKRYDFVNRFGRTVWAKLVRPMAQAAKNIQKSLDAETVEVKIVDKFLTPVFVFKEISKFESDHGVWQKSFIPQFLGTIWHTFIVEETFNILRKFHNPKIDFALLNRLVVARIKEFKPELFY